MGPALLAKAGSRGKIQLRCFQGQRASLLSQRHKVAPLISATKPCAITCWRISSTESRHNGSPGGIRKLAGECLYLNDETGGEKQALRPPRGCASRPGNRARANRLRHLLTI